MIATTSLRTTKQITEKAKRVAIELNIPYIDRNDQPIPRLHNVYECDVLVAGSNRLSIYQLGLNEPLFFHPNSAMFRVKRFLRGEIDPFLKVSKLSSEMSIVDCTLGLASDSILSSVVVGKKGHVVGVEGNRFLSYIVRHGLLNWQTGLKEMDEAMRRIDVVEMKNFEYLRSQKDNSFDVVYFDPMFEFQVKESDGINKIRQFTLSDPLDEETLEEAKRVARQRVVLKDHWKSTRFDRFGFNVFKRPTSKFHYASIEL